MFGVLGEVIILREYFEDLSQFFGNIELIDLWLNWYHEFSLFSGENGNVEYFEEFPIRLVHRFTGRFLLFF